MALLFNVKDAEGNYKSDMTPSEFIQFLNKQFDLMTFWVEGDEE